MYVFCFCFGSQNRSSNLHCCYGGGVDDPEIFMGIEDERLPKSSKKNNIMMYSFVMSWNCNLYIAFLISSRFSCKIELQS